jgi:hypothetical protein
LLGSLKTTIVPCDMATARVKLHGIPRLLLTAIAATFFASSCRQVLDTPGTTGLPIVTRRAATTPTSDPSWMSTPYVCSADRPQPLATANPLPWEQPESPAFAHPVPPEDHRGSVVVAVGLAEVESEVLSWLDPTRGPRIEWSRYLQADVLVTAIGHWPVSDQWSGEVNLLNVDRVAGPVIAVLATTRGLDMYYIWSAVGLKNGPSACAPLPSRDRETVLAVFDAVTGERLAALLVRRDWPVAIPDFLVRQAPVSTTVDPPSRRPVVVVPTATPWPWSFTTATPPPTEPSPGARLTRATLPESLRGTFESYPLVPGTWWSWRLVDRVGGVRWRVTIITETVEAAWRVADDGVAVRSRIDAHLLTPTNRGDYRPTYLTPRWRYVWSRMIAGTRADAIGSASDSMGDDVLPGASEIPAEALLSPWSDNDVGYTGYIDLAAPGTKVETTAGVFDDCHVVSIQGGASFGTERAFCAGVGYVRTEYFSCSVFGAVGSADLVGYHVGNLPAK